MNGWTSLKQDEKFSSVLSDDESRVTTEKQDEFLAVYVKPTKKGPWYCTLYRAERLLASGAGRTKQGSWDAAIATASAIEGKPLEFTRTAGHRWVPKTA